MKRDQEAMASCVRAEGRCRICRTPFNLQAHHVVPRRTTQSDAPANLICLCMDCHRLVHDHKVDIGPYLTPAEGANAVLLTKTVHAAHGLLYPSER